MAASSVVNVWLHPESGWMSKLARAGEHLGSLREQVKLFRASKPYTVTTEGTDTPDKVAYRLHVHKPVPAAIANTVGDMAHNLNSALDNLAYGMAQANLGHVLSAAQKRASTFPICASPPAFDSFFSSTSQGTLRTGMYGANGKAALRAVQPFVIHESALSHNVPVTDTYEDDFRWYPLNALRTVANIDKHRYLAVMSWALELVYWVSNQEKSNRRWIPQATPGRLTDGEVLGYTIGTDPGMGNDSVFTDFNLVLEDDPAHDPRSPRGTADVVATLENWHHTVTYTIYSAIHHL